MRRFLSRGRERAPSADEWEGEGDGGDSGGAAFEAAALGDGSLKLGTLAQQHEALHQRVALASPMDDGSTDFDWQQRSALGSEQEGLESYASHASSDFLEPELALEGLGDDELADAGGGKGGKGGAAGRSISRVFSSGGSSHLRVHSIETAQEKPKKRSPSFRSPFGRSKSKSSSAISFEDGVVPC